MKSSNNLKMKTMKKYILTVITITALSISFSGTLTAQDLPLYVSSVIENATPVRLDITYDLTLANIIPPTSAFTVRVNTVTRSVNSIAILGNNVQLTISTPVVYGDVITFSYTRSTNNPLQTPEGGQAASLTSQNVTNNVAAGIFLMPTVGTSVVTAIASTSATITSNVISDGGAPVIARGVCWNTSGSPTISGNHTSDGTGTGSFTSLMTGLVPNTTYYVRAYATNSEGTAYGPELSLNTCPAAPTIGTITQPSCTVATGSVVLTGLPIRGMFQWIITISPGGTTYTGFGDNTTITDLANGTYSFTVSIVGCTSPASENVVINPQPATPTAEISEPITVCKGASNPSITFTGVGGTPPYTFSFGFNDSGPFNVTTSGENSSVDIDVPLETADLLYDYRIWSVTDANGCSRTGLNLGTVVTVVSATVSTDDATIITSGSATLNGTVNANNFSADISFEYGLTPAYGDSITATPGTVTGTDVTTVSGTVTGLEANTLYHFRVVASIQGCRSYGEDLTFTTLCPPITPTISVTNVSCFGQATGSVHLSVAGGLAPYNYLWSNEATTEDLSLLSAGTYSVTVTDANGCTASASADVTQPAAPLGTTFGVQEVLCYGQSTGEIFMTVTGGTPPYTYIWSIGATTEDISGLAAGTYTLTVTDDNGCTNETIVNVTQPDVLNAIVTSSHVTCNGANDGSIIISDASGGTGGSGDNYSYTIDGGTNWQTSGSFSELSPGNYIVQIRDGEITSCIITLDSDLEITEPDVLYATVAHTDVNCNGSNDGSITIEDPSGGSGTYLYRYDGGDAWSESGSFTNIPPGTYNVEIRDGGVESDCIVTLVVGLAIGEPAALSVSASSTNVLCFGGSNGAIDITVTGGTTPYTFLWNNDATTEDLSGLTAETYNVTVTDANGCTVNASADVTQPNEIIVNHIITNVSCNTCKNGSINISVTGGTGEYAFSWTGPDGYTSASEDLTNLFMGTYNLLVTDANSCVRSFAFNVLNPTEVTNVTDNGYGSLRYALVYANSTLDVKETITFNIPGTGPFTIKPETELPSITDPVVIDGYSQPGTSADNSMLLIEIDGTDAGEGSAGLAISGGRSTVKGLIINRFNGSGVVITTSGENLITGNYIGVDYTGTKPMGNGGSGIQLMNLSSGNIFGGTGNGEKNVISGNGSSGISIGTYGSGNIISTNSIYDNGGIGIDLGDDGITANDNGDTDTGPNALQNFPVLKSLRFSQGSVTISGSLNSAAGTDYLLQFFVNKIGDESGYGEGQKYIGSAKVTTDPSGNATFSETFPVYSSWGGTITATATDPGGSTSEFSKAIGGLKEQIVAAADWPLHYSINKDGLLKVPETSTLDIDAINAAFKTWTDITTSTVEFIGDGKTDLKYAGIDSVNLVSFVDDRFDFGEGVLAVAAKTTEVDENDVQIRIIDADIIFNPYWVNNPEYNFGVGNDGQYGGYFDIQSVATHEIGHVFGLIHSGIPGSTMFFMLGTGTFVRTLANDDIAWAGYRYQESNYSSTFGSISGTITYGYSPVGDPQPVAGALIKAVNTDPNIKYSVHSYSNADGTYLVPGLIPGTYEVFIEPLDGDVGGFNLKPQNISDYLSKHTVYLDYPGEFYNVDDIATEADNSKTSIAVSAGITTTGKDLITNQDLTSPYVVSVSPDETITDFDIVKDITISFSEAIDINTLTDETIYLEYSDGVNTVKHYGEITPIGNGTNIILINPNSVLKYGTYYTLYVTQGVKDLKGNSLVVMADGVPVEESFMSAFTTMAADENVPGITYVIPSDNTKNVFVTEKIILAFSEPMDKSSVEAAFALTWNEGTPAVVHEVDGSWQWDNKNMVMTYAPLRSLSEATVYTVTVSETAEDLGGNNLAAAQSFTFETVPSSPPQIIYLGPDDAATGVTVETPVVVDFSEPVNPETVSSATFRLTPAGGIQVPGTFEFLNDNSRVVFRPDASLSFKTSYTIELTSGIEDVSQPAMGMEVASTTTFTTASQITTPHIQYLEPSAGTTGSIVLISGFGFDPDPAKNRVSFNGIQTYVKNATLTELTTVVPNGVMSGPVTVTVNSVVSDNTMQFDIIPESLDPCSDVVANTSTETQVTHDVDIRGDCAYAYVTNPDDNTVSVVDLDPANPEVVAIVDVGKTPMKIDIDPQGTRAYVTNYNSHDVSVIDISNENGAIAEVVNTIKVGIEPYGIAVTPDGKRVYVANHYSENLSIIDVDPKSGGFDHVVANVSTGSGTTSVAISGECALAVVTGDFGVKIVNADPEDPGYNSVIATVTAGTKTKEVDISGEAGLAIVTTEEGNLLVINLYPEGGDYSDAVVANVPTGTQVSDVKISGDCMFVYVTDTQNGNVLVYKFTQTGTGIPDGSYIAGLGLVLHNTIEVGTSPIGLAIDDKAERLFITDGDIVGRRVTEIRICCGPIMPATELSELIMIIQNLITYGGIKESQGNTLIKKCNSALANIYGGKPKSAINNLNAFINTVKGFMAGGKISRDQGNELIARAEAIISMLKGTKSAETGLLPSDFDKLVNKEELVSESGLGVIYPNPFSESVVINYGVAAGDPGTAKVLIRIFDMSGRLIRTLVDANMQPGCNTILWDGKNNNDVHVPDGTYIIHFRAGIAEDVREIILIK